MQERIEQRQGGKGLLRGGGRMGALGGGGGDPAGEAMPLGKRGPAGGLPAPPGGGGAGGGGGGGGCAGFGLGTGGGKGGGAGARPPGGSKLGSALGGGGSAAAAAGGGAGELTFDTVRQDRLGLHLFKKFCRTHFHEHTLLFVMEVGFFRQGVQAAAARGCPKGAPEVRRAAKVVCAKYVEAGSKLQLELPEGMVKTILATVGGGEEAAKAAAEVEVAAEGKGQGAQETEAQDKAAGAGEGGEEALLAGLASVFDGAYADRLASLESTMWQEFARSQLLRAWRDKIAARILQAGAGKPGTAAEHERQAFVQQADLNYVLGSLLGEFAFTSYVFSPAGRGPGGGQLFGRGLYTRDSTSAGGGGATAAAAAVSDGVGGGGGGGGGVGGVGGGAAPPLPSRRARRAQTILRRFDADLLQLQALHLLQQRVADSGGTLADAPPADLFDDVAAAAMAVLEDMYFPAFKRSAQFEELVQETLAGKQRILQGQGRAVALAAPAADLSQLTLAVVLRDRLGMHILKKHCREQVQEQNLLFWLETSGGPNAFMNRYQAWGLTADASKRALQDAAPPPGLAGGAGPARAEAKAGAGAEAKEGEAKEGQAKEGQAEAKAEAKGGGGAAGGGGTADAKASLSLSHSPSKAHDARACERAELLRKARLLCGKYVDDRSKLQLDLPVPLQHRLQQAITAAEQVADAVGAESVQASRTAAVVAAMSACVVERRQFLETEVWPQFTASNLLKAWGARIISRMHDGL
jgi:hypothetical protein